MRRGSLALSIGCLCLPGCDFHRSAPPQKAATATESEKHSGTPLDDCHQMIGAEIWFIGNPECMRRLPKARMSGVWVRDLEYSVFYEGASHVPGKAGENNPHNDQADVWLDLDPDDLLDRQGYRFDGHSHAYRVEFIGTKSDVHGVYGHFGAFRHGVLMQRLLSIREITR